MGTLIVRSLAFIVIAGAMADPFIRALASGEPGRVIPPVVVLATFWIAAAFLPMPRARSLKLGLAPAIVLFTVFAVAFFGVLLEIEARLVRLLSY